MCFHITFWRIEDFEDCGRSFVPGVAYLVHAGNNAVGKLKFIQVVPGKGHMTFAVEFIGNCLISFLSHFFPENDICLMFIAEERS